VKDNNYWSTLADFIHGCCSRQTTEVRLLHNELIWMIIHNAHFAKAPPQNVSQKRIKRFLPPIKHQIPPPAGLSLAINTAVDLGHLRSLAQLNTRIGIVMNQLRLKADSNATRLVFSETRQYVLALLRESLTFIVNDVGKGHVVLKLAQIPHAVDANRELASVVFPLLSAKSASLLPSISPETPFNLSNSIS
jgi:hypothetical protein